MHIVFFAGGIPLKLQGRLELVPKTSTVVIIIQEHPATNLSSMQILTMEFPGTKHWDSWGSQSAAQYCDAAGNPGVASVPMPGTRKRNRVAVSHSTGTTAWYLFGFGSRYSVPEELHSSRSGPPGPGPTHSPAYARFERRAGPGGPAQTRGSAPQPRSEALAGPCQIRATSGSRGTRADQGVCPTAGLRSPRRPMPDSSQGRVQGDPRRPGGLPHSRAPRPSPTRWRRTAFRHSCLPPRPEVPAGFSVEMSLDAAD
jgi:hypothetical protein